MFLCKLLPFGFFKKKGGKNPNNTHIPILSHVIVFASISETLALNNVLLRTNQGKKDLLAALM